MLQLRLILGGALLLGAFAVIAVASFFGNRQAYYTVDELLGETGAGQPAVAAELAPNQAAEGPRMVVRGDIDKATVWRSPDGLTLRFTIVGKDQALPVEYTGLVPDTFDRATQVTVGGRMAAGGAFAADQLAVQCPAKYEALPPGAATAVDAASG